MRCRFSRESIDSLRETGSLGAAPMGNGTFRRALIEHGPMESEVRRAGDEAADVAAAGR